MQFAKISPQLIISSRSEYQVGNQHRIAERKNSGQMSFICPWARRPWSRWLDCHYKLCLQQETCHILGGLCAPHWHFRHVFGAWGSLSEQVGIRRPHLTDNWRTACWGNRTRDLPVMNRVGPHRRAALLPPWRSALLITAACWPPNGAVGRENVSGPDDLFLFICRFLCISLLGARQRNIFMICIMEEWLYLRSEY